ncbi:cytochrome P450 [Mycobacterium crocinum]|uniref:Cytochrome P450 n=1 Tax=Mycolicibacterium crocinum TaxID=388459 RepID=A0ABY3TR65_9MYCO|nr:cytochrome P450 [Mycolicibacterium crocinum]MCV7217285.1 cytochrome P450 [Mycolicibacterium crocinum]ULN42184.1 cytochrome P450 [Mycolicibacterium crocinum]
MRPPGLPAPKPFSALFGGLYAAAYGLGGQPLVHQAIKRLGPVVALPVLGFGPVVAVADAALAKEVFTAKPDVLLGGEGVGPAAAIYGSESMFVQEEPEHLRRRRLLTPPLHGTALDDYVPAIQAATRAAMATWPVGTPMRMLEAARDLTFDVIVQVMFGVEDPAEVRRLGEPFDELLALAISPETPLRYSLRRVGGLRTWGSLAAVNRRIDEIVFGVIAERRANPRPGGGILSMLIDARGEDGERMSDKEIRADLITLVLAGHETTATTLAWLVDLLLHHPQAMELVQAEAQSGASAFTEAVISETLRLRPPAPITGRMTAGHYRLGDYTLQPGTRIVLLLDVINRDPESYPEPDEFRPERFVGARPHPYAWIPFGGGIKRCIGASFAMCELVTVLHTMLREGRFEPVSPHLEIPRSGATPVLVPRNGALVYFSHETRSQPVVCR